MITCNYDKSEKLYVAFYSDRFGQLGPAMYGSTRELACFNLGHEMGGNPQRFTRDIGEYMPAYEAEIEATA